MSEMSKATSLPLAENSTLAPGQAQVDGEPIDVAVEAVGDDAYVEGDSEDGVMEVGRIAEGGKTESEGSSVDVHERMCGGEVRDVSSSLSTSMQSSKPVEGEPAQEDRCTDFKTACVERIACITAEITKCFFGGLTQAHEYEASSTSSPAPKIEEAAVHVKDDEKPSTSKYCLQRYNEQSEINPSVSGRNDVAEVHQEGANTGKGCASLDGPSTSQSSQPDVEDNGGVDKDAASTSKICIIDLESSEACDNFDAAIDLLMYYDELLGMKRSLEELATIIEKVYIEPYIKARNFRELKRSRVDLSRVNARLSMVNIKLELLEAQFFCNSESERGEDNNDGGEGAQSSAGKSGRT